MAAKKTLRKTRISQKSEPKPGGQRMLSRGGWKLLLDADGVLRIHSPSGRVFTLRPGGRS
jgi:hypothetical protein